MLYYEPINDDIPNNDLSSAELEEVLDLKKQLVIVQPSELSYLSISTTFNQLGRWEEAISHSKKGIRAQFVRAGTSGGRVSVKGVKSLGGHFACLCRGFEFYEVNNFFL